jgi:hypothetical protein
MPQPQIPVEPPVPTTRYLSIDELMAMQTKIVLAANTAQTWNQLHVTYDAALVTVSLPYDLWRDRCATFPDPIGMITYQEDGIDWIEIDCTLWYAMQMAEVVGIKSMLVEVDVME